MGSCKDISVKGLLAQFKKMQGLMSGLCYESSSVSSRSRRSYDDVYYPGGYGGGGVFNPNTIWFQYLLCQEQKISCYFFTQGWNQKDYGQYYLYQNVLDTSSVKPPATNDLLTLALLSGTGKQQYYPHEGYPAPAYPSYKKRRNTRGIDFQGFQGNRNSVEGNRNRAKRIDTKEMKEVSCEGDACATTEEIPCDGDAC